MDELIFKNNVPVDILIFKEDWFVDVLDALTVNNKDSKTLIDTVLMIILLTLNVLIPDKKKKLT